MNLNISWGPAPSGQSNQISRKININVPESGLVKPGAYLVETRGNKIYWPLKDNK